MQEKITNRIEKEVSRRDLLKSAGTVAAGAALLYTGTGIISSAEAKGTKEAPFPFPYKKLDAELAREIAYENWYKGFCAYASSSAILLQLKDKVGGPYKHIPIEAFSFGHGGTVGWGTLCGTLFGAGIAASFAAGKTGEKIINDTMAWYCDTQLPIYKPAKPQTKIRSVNASNSPLCHVSVGKWMKKENVKFFSPQRKDRCARLSADVAAKTIELLNAMHDGKYKPTHGSQAKMYDITAQNNCTECHGNDIPKVPGT